MKNAHRAIKTKPVPPRLAPAAATRPEGKRCVAMAASGERCKSAPLRGKKRCAFHSGDTAKVLGARGGRRRAIFNADELEPLPVPKDARDLLQLMMRTLADVREQRIDTKTANAVFYGGGACLAALEVADLEARLKKLEEQAALSGPRASYDEQRGKVLQ